MLGYSFGALTAFLITPYTVHNLGDQLYGLLVMAGILVGYFGLLDLGINTSFVKFISEAEAKGDRRAIGTVVSTGVMFYLLLSVLLGVPAFIWSGRIADLLNVSAELQGPASFAVRAGVVLFVASSLSAPVSSVQRGMQRMDITNKLGMFFALLGAIGTVLVIKAGYGFEGVMSVTVGTACLKALSDSAAAFYVCPGLSVSWRLADKVCFRRLFMFGLKLQVAKISGILSAHLDKLLILYFLSAGMLTAYQVGNMIVVYAVSAFVLATNALLPAFTEIFHAGSERAAIEGYEMGTAYLSFAAAPAFVFLMVFAPELIRLWMGEGYGAAALALRVLSAGWMVNTILGSVGGAFVQALGRPEVQMRGALLNIFLNPLLSIALIYAAGFPGAVTGTSLSVAVSALYFTWDLHRRFRLPLRNVLLRGLAVPVGLAALAALPAAGVSFLIEAGFAAGKAGMILGLAAAVPAFAGIYLLLLWRVKPGRRADADRVFGAGREGLRRAAYAFCGRD